MPKDTVGNPISRILCTYGASEELQFVCGLLAIQTSAKLTRETTASVSIAFHLQAPPIPSKVPAKTNNTRLRILPISEVSAAVNATKPHNRKYIKKASIIAIRDITKRKLLVNASPAARYASWTSPSRR